MSDDESIKKNTKWHICDGPPSASALTLYPEPIILIKRKNFLPIVVIKNWLAQIYWNKHNKNNSKGIPTFQQNQDSRKLAKEYVIFKERCFFHICTRWRFTLVKEIKQ